MEHIFQDSKERKTRSFSSGSFLFRSTIPMDGKWWNQKEDVDGKDFSFNQSGRCGPENIKTRKIDLHEMPHCSAYVRMTGNWAVPLWGAREMFRSRMGDWELREKQIRVWSEVGDLPLEQQRRVHPSRVSV